MYVGLVLLLHLPFVQEQIGNAVANALSEKVGTNVKLGKVQLGFLNRIIVDDIYVEDQEKRPMLEATRTSATIALVPLLSGKIQISTAQVFGLKANLSKKSPDAPLNCQFVIDAFSSDEKKEPSLFYLNVHSLIVRHATVNYDVESEEMTKGKFNHNHLSLSDMGITASIKTLTNDSVNVTVKRFDFKENNSGLELQDFKTAIAANKQSAFIDSLHLATSNSTFNLGPTSITYPRYTTDGSLEFTSSIRSTTITPSDFQSFLPTLSEFKTPISIETGISGTSSAIKLKNTSVLSQDHSLQFLADTDIGIRGNKVASLNTHIGKLDIHPEGVQSLSNALKLDESTRNTLLRLGHIHLDGEASKDEEYSFADLNINTDAGNLTVSGTFDVDKNFVAQLKSDSFNLKQILHDEKLGQTAFNVNVDGNLAHNHQPSGTVSGTIEQLEYSDYTYQNIMLNGVASADGFEGHATIDDPNIKLVFDGKIDHLGSLAETDMNVSLQDFNPHALHLTNDYAGETFHLRARVNTKGNSPDTAEGYIEMDSIYIKTPEQLLSVHSLLVNAKNTGDGQRSIDIDGDFIHASLVGTTHLADLVPSFQNQLAQHLPSLINYSPKAKRNQHYQLRLELSENPILHHFVKEDFTILRPINIEAEMDDNEGKSNLILNAPRISYNGTEYNNVRLNYEGDANLFNLQASLFRQQKKNSCRFSVNSTGKDNRLLTDLSWNTLVNNSTSGKLSTATQFENNQGKTEVDIHILPSDIVINDTIWHVSDSEISILDKNIDCKNVKISNENRYLSMNGKISESMTDSLVAELNDISIQYVLDLINFTAVKFVGHASGHAYIRNVFQKPDFHANLTVPDFGIQKGRLGMAMIHANWDEDVKGVKINANIFDKDKDKDRYTNCTGFVSPAQNDIQLQIDANNTNAELLNSFLGSIFDDIQGDINGVVNVVGPLNDIGLVGDASANIDMTLRATKVRYHINPNDTIHLRPYRFNFDNIRIADSRSNEGVVNGYVSHRNIKNFQYEFNVDLNHLLAYEETQFNNDKFMGRVFANGQLTLRGADGHPLNINADLTPTRGSFFAYDSATPDAIATSSFIKFYDREKTATQTDSTTHFFHVDSIFLRDSDNDDLLLEAYKQKNNDKQKEDENPYRGDIFMNVGIHLNPDCEIKLRMDNADDGYISTYGNGTLQAYYHNKGSFTLDGTYNIQSGRYRLYLQDIIYRDLDIQNGSSVVFNGNPFGANIHLICWHTLNAVPLNDLTSNSGYSSNNKVKVICILDITGNLNNMTFNFDINLPNVNDETRQLVRSLISTDEEMNTQMIYLLGLGRFYTNEYARASGTNNSAQAMNNLLSSTISGQINQMLSSVIGSESKWNFGTGLSTGEQGWQDLDIEGILSGRLLDDRLLINGNFGYRDNPLKQSASFIGDFDVKWRITPNGNTYLKAYNQNNDRYFTKATLNTQGVGISYQRDFEKWRDLFRHKMSEQKVKNQ